MKSYTRLGLVMLGIAFTTSACSTRTQIVITPEAFDLRTLPSHIVVREFESFAGVKVSDLFITKHARTIARSLSRARDIGAAEVRYGPGESAGKGIEVQGAITLITEGSPAARLWIGFGVGKTRLEANVRLVDAQTKTVLATSHVRTSNTWDGLVGALTTTNDLLAPFAREVVGLVREYKYRIEMNR